MRNQSIISRFHSGFIPLLSLLVCLLFLICIGPGSTQGFAAQVTLAWDANTDPAVAGYKLYYGTASRTYGTPVDVGKVTQYTLTGIQEGVNAYFAVTAYDASRNESAFSTELPCFSLVPTPCVNGSISPSSAVVDSLGMSQTFTITPAANYKISAVTVDGASVGEVSSYTFSNVTANHTIAASFTVASSTYTISASAGTNGTITPSGSVSVSYGGSQTFSITPNTGYQVKDVLVDGTSAGAVTSYTFSNVTAAHSIAASFIAKTNTVAASAGTNGTITPSGSVSVSYGGSQTFSITPSTNYKISTVTVDGKSVGAVSSYTFSSVTAAHNITASFTANTKLTRKNPLAVTGRAITSLDTSFVSSGVSIYNSDRATWTQVSSVNPENMIYSGSTLYGDFGASGIWMWDGSAWTQITSSNPENMVASDSVLYGDFGASGIWMWDGSAWTQITSSNPEGMAASGTVLYGDFGASGIWMWSGGAETAWTQITTSNPEGMMASGSVLYGDFGASGIWMWDGSAWTQVTTSNPEGMVASGSVLYGDFEASGIWMWDGTAWTQITGSNTDKMAV
jgi:hypothetical protein